jgi:hypothetical protein
MEVLNPVAKFDPIKQSSEQTNALKSPQSDQIVISHSRHRKLVCIDFEKSSKTKLGYVYETIRMRVCAADTHARTRDQLGIVR